MPQMQTIVLSRDDGSEQRNYVPRGIQNNVATLVDGTGVPLGERRLTLSQTRTANGRIKVVMKLTIPVTQTETVGTTETTKIVRTQYAELSFNFDAGSTAIERKDIVWRCIQLLNYKNDTNSATFQKPFLIDLEGLY